MSEPTTAFIPGRRTHPVHVCCGDFARALQRGTDNEGYGTLIYALDDKNWCAGVGLPTITYCPWCGQELWPVVAPDSKD